MRTIAARLCAIFYGLISGGRVRGASFILRKPSTLRIGSGNHVSIGRNVMIDKDARIFAVGGNIVIGDDTFIGKNVTLIAFADMEIGSRTLLGQNCSLHTENHGPAGNRDAFTANPIRIGDDVWLGAGVVVTSGRSVADSVTVGANSVVTRDLESGATYGGVPAKPIGTAR